MKHPPPPAPPMVEPPPTPPLDPVLARLSQAARQVADEAAASAIPPARWGRLQDARVRRARRARARAIGLAFALPTLLLMAWGARRWLPGERAIDYRVDGAVAVGEGGYIHDVGGGGARLRFSEGTQIDLDAGARAWVVERGPHGARLRLENGRASFDVNHRAGARWSVDAGPFAIEVTGTAFDVTWMGADEELAVRLWRGSVEVRGPQIDRGFRLRPGQRLVAHVRARKIDVEEGAADVAPPSSSSVTALAVDDRDAAVRAGSDASSAPPSPPPAETAGGASPPAPNPNRPPAAAPPRARPARDAKRAPSPVAAVAPSGPASWAARVAAGDFRGVIDEAQALGVDGCASACRLDALAALADAARYAGREALARRLLLAERERFPGTPPAQAAAFLLGRMADEGSAGLTGGARSPAALSTAVEWFDRYLDEAPKGVYGSEALGRKMLAVETLGDHAAARRLAADYLRRYPAGVYVSQAALIQQR